MPLCARSPSRCGEGGRAAGQHTGGRLITPDAAPKASVLQGEKSYDTTVHEVSRPLCDSDFHPEQLRRKLEDFVRQERDRGAE